MQRLSPTAALTLAAGFTAHSGGAAPAPVTRHHMVQLRQPGEGCLSAWNSAANRAARAATLPPPGPYRIGGDGPRVWPRGGYEVFVGASVSIGIGNMGVIPRGGQRLDGTLSPAPRGNINYGPPL